MTPRLALLAAVGLGLFIGPASGACADDEWSHVAVGDRVPAFELTTIDGEQISSGNTLGRVVLLNFFATWCGPCLAELPHVQTEVWERYAREGLVLVVVGREHDADELRSFREQHAYSFPFAADPERAVYGLFADKFIPRNIVVGRDGTIVYQSKGYTAEEFEHMLSVIQGELEKGDPTPFAAVPFEPGLPDFGPARQLGLTTPQRASIAGAAGQRIDIIHDAAGTWQGRYWLLQRRDSGSPSMLSSSMSREEDGVFSATQRLPLVHGQTESAADLEFRVVDETLEYRWRDGGPTAGGTATARASPVGVGKPLPDLPLTLLDGGNLRTRELRGSVVVVNWWHTHCYPCIQEIPELDALAKRHADNAQVVFVAIAHDEPEALRSFLDGKPFGYQHTLGDERTRRVLGDSFPRHLVLDREGIVRFDRIGGGTGAGAPLAAALEHALAAAPLITPLITPGGPR